MECTCIRGIYNFYVKAVDIKTLVYKDLSDWMDDDNYILPEKYTVFVTPPGTSKSEKLELLVSSINKIDQFGTLKNGIYCFETTSCGVKYTKSVAIFPKLECCVKQAWATLGIEFKTRIEEVESYMRSASINAEYNNVKTASQNLKIAEKLLENLKCDCDC